MSAVISIAVHSPEADELVLAVGRRLGIDPRLGRDSTWELRFDDSYREAHRSVCRALDEARADWPGLVTIDYALTA